LFNDCEQRALRSLGGTIVRVITTDQAEVGSAALGQ
jgi:hypothetical protein